MIIFFFAANCGFFSHNIVWNSSKKPSAKSVKSSACANSAGTPSRKQTNHKHVYCKPTTRHKPVDGMERWLVRGPHSNLKDSNRAGSSKSSDKRCDKSLKRVMSLFLFILFDKNSTYLNSFLGGKGGQQLMHTHTYTCDEG